MGLQANPWCNLSFASKGAVACDACAYANWQTTSLHQIGCTVYVLTYLSINVALASDPKTYLLGLLDATDVNVEALFVRKIISFQRSLAAYS